MIWWTLPMVRRVEELAAERLSGQRIAFKINAEFGTFLSADAVRRQAAYQGIKLHGKSGPPKGYANPASQRPFTGNRDDRGRFAGHALKG